MHKQLDYSNMYVAGFIMLPTYIAVGMLAPALPLFWAVVVVAITLYISARIYEMTVIQGARKNRNAFVLFAAQFAVFGMVLLMAMK